MNSSHEPVVSPDKSVAGTTGWGFRVVPSVVDDLTARAVYQQRALSYGPRAGLYDQVRPSSSAGVVGRAREVGLGLLVTTGR